MSNTKIRTRVKRKTDLRIVETANEARRNKEWNKVATLISGSRRNYSSVGLKEIDRKTKAGDTVVVVGKVLGAGIVTKKLRVCALGFSESAKEKLKSQNSEAVFVIDEIKKNPKAQGVKIIK